MGDGYVIDFTDLTLEQTRALEDIFYEMQPDYNLMIKKLSEAQTIGEYWWLTSIASRNVYQSPLCIRCAQMLLLKNLVASRNPEVLKTGEPINITTDDKALYKAIKRFERETGLNFIIDFKKGSCKARIKPFLLGIYRLFRIFYEMLFWRIHRSSYKQLAEHGPYAIIDSFLIDSMIKNGEYKERYFNGLAEQLEAAGKNVLFLPTILFSTKAYAKSIKALKCVGEKFVFIENFLTWNDYLKGIVLNIKIHNYQYAGYRFREIDIQDLLNEETRAQLTDTTLLKAYLITRGFERMKGKVDVEMLIDWFENQPIDKATFYALNRHFPDAKTIAYSGVMGSLKHWPHFSSTKEEESAGFTAKYNAVMGSGMLADTKKYNPNLSVKIMPAFRFSYLWENDFTVGSRIVAALPFEHREAIIILTVLSECIKKEPKLRNKTVIVKRHPADHHDYTDYIDVDNITFSGGEFRSLLSDCNVMIATASSTCMESVAMGIPTIVMGFKSKLTYNPIPAEIDDGIWRLCYDTNDVMEALKHFIGISDEEKENIRRIGQEVKDKYFSPVNDDWMRDLEIIP